MTKSRINSSDLLSGLELMIDSYQGKEQILGVNLNPVIVRLSCEEGCVKVIEMARRLGVTADTVRFYTRIKILKPGKNKTNGYREYSESDYNRLRFVLSARQLGFSVEDIQEILNHADKKKSPCPTVRRLIDQRLNETEQRFAETLQLRERMQQAVVEWSQKPDKVPTGHMICHLIEEFAQ